ncbi:sigma-70 family RNA polymerase sigma factor [Paenibacillus sp. HN-1]|uniref:sigma-70 family RNA polymerase sigma factor n=1 Tax=Paenibacillus TaxID=44249 RepID=UPI001CAA1877|nr:MULTISPECIES: sigma-70 family RNA polymerase sigma factor [Paenibacillus]MBY9077257.1 sigma-70 family RNA polymerase sigma factor [Paenibacillus sp. CGMCC 1.18879]MBY9083304.1 sigma-70 family RNA polymerase sigma factor [Paenibacillus sinensis]
MSARLIDYNPYLGHKDEVVQQNMGLVYHIANKFRGYINQGIGYEDLASEGSIGLLKAFEYFDPTKVEGGVKFATYAGRMIQGYIQTFISTKGSSVKTPRGILAIISAINKHCLWDATSSQIAEKLDYSIGEVEEALHYLENRNVASLDLQANEESESISLMGLIPSKDDSTHIFVAEFIESLGQREQSMIKMFMAGVTQKEMAEELGMSQSYISRLMLRIGKKYKKYLGITGSEEMRMKSEVVTRRITAEEAKQHGVKTILDEIEWFTDSALPDTPSIGLNLSGAHINVAAAKEIGCAIGDFLQLGFNASGNRLVIRKGSPGIKARKAFGKEGSVNIVSKALVAWLESKDVVRQRYALEFDETTGTHFIKLEIGSTEAETA